MLEKLSERFTEKLVSLGIVQKEDAEIYSFGFFSAFHDADKCCHNYISWGCVPSVLAVPVVKRLIYSDSYVCRRTSCQQSGKVLLVIYGDDCRTVGFGAMGVDKFMDFWRFDFDFKCGDCDFIARRNRK